MNIPLKKHQAEWVAEQISAGRYASELEAIEDAIASKIRKDEAAWVADGEKLRERLERSLKDMREGRVIVTDDAFWRDKYALIDRIAADKKI